MSTETYYIYALRHNKTKKLYIGCTKNPARLQTHLYNLRNGQHHNAELQDDYFKHGDDLTFFLLDTIRDDSWGHNAHGREAYWIHYYGTDIPKRGYNSHKIYKRIPISEFPIIIPNHKSIKLDYSDVETAEAEETNEAV